MPGAHQAGGSVDRRSVVVAVALLGDAGVQRHAHPQRPNLTPRLGLEPTLRVQGCRNGIGHAAEHGVEGVAHRLDDVTAMLLDGAAHERIVPGQR